MQFIVSDMTCGHCVSRITKAVKAEDRAASVEIDLPRRIVKVQSTLSREQIAQHIIAAGYTPTEAS